MDPSLWGAAEESPGWWVPVGEPVDGGTGSLSDRLRPVALLTGLHSLAHLV